MSEFAELKNKLYSVHEKVEGLALSPYQNLSPAVSEALKTLSLTRVPMISVNNRLTELEQRVAEISNTSG